MRIEAAIDRLAWAPRASERPRRGLSVLHAETVVPAPLEQTFAFFADAANLERLTPPWLNLRIRTPLPLTMAEGLEIDYRIVLHGLPIPWRSRIDVWEPGVRFVDRQVLGPYRWWHHEHRFESSGEETRVIDHIEFVPRVRWITGPLVRRDVGRIFAFRKEELGRLFGG
jgi:ligand-binding SRPBCC domain-containing protein